VRTRIQIIHTSPNLIGTEQTVKGWLRTVRAQKTFAFLEVNDGSSMKGLQVILPQEIDGYEELLKELTTGAAISAMGILQESPGDKQAVELKASHIEVIGSCDATRYPLQKKRHSFEFLREIAHLRPRTNTLGAITRVRNCLAYTTHQFFQKKGFFYVHTPLITLSDCEGAGEMFQVTTVEPHQVKKTESGESDYSVDFFGQKAYLTVSGQLNAEIYACALSDVYTFGPTFRAENSNTSRHLAEFWMIEPEMAFADLQDDMALAEQYLKTLFGTVLEECSEEMHFFDRFISKGIVERLKGIANEPFVRLTYTEAIEILQRSGKKFEYPYEWGVNLQSEHERYLAEEHCKKPVIVYNYPEAIKPFYMRLNEDEKTVAAMDVLLPGIGEIIGGSQREERLDILKQRMKIKGLDPEHYWWYLELREYGSVPHAGFGAGFERLVQFTTGMENIRDVIPFPRYPGNAAF
jgi:asparaginyl-tRNA synthetase